MQLKTGPCVNIEVHAGNLNLVTLVFVVVLHYGDEYKVSCQQESTQALTMLERCSPHLRRACCEEQQKEANSMQEFGHVLPPESVFPTC